MFFPEPSGRCKIPPFELLVVRRIPQNPQTQAITTILDHPPELEDETSLENGTHTFWRDQVSTDLKLLPCWLTFTGL